MKKNEILKVLEESSNGCFHKGHVKWLEMLIQDNADLEIFSSILDQNRGAAGIAIIQFRRFLSEHCNRGYVTLEQLKNALYTRDYSSLKGQLEELFLEPICYSHKQLEKQFTKISLEKLYKLHMQDRGARFLKIKQFAYV
ncbi:hypothetical protein [Wukongibacter sp. M2B1]|uniref:hypothetical protein n=1 Tax=Wukongibacter sp. M2B1 TaxID=3088895 RepID=UPI003D7A3891